MDKDFKPPYKEVQGGEDELVECEMEAAQALACLAQPLISNNNNDEFLVAGSSGCCEEQAIEGQSEQESEPKTNPRHALNCPPATSRRSRQNLTEEEKEQRRLSRVLANRESARQTIRRRQAMYEELTRKAADLASENESLKKKKEMAAKEYDSLKNQNASLRLQIAKAEKAEGEETDGASTSKPVHISTTRTGPAPSPAPYPTPTPSPMPPLFWPSIVQPFNSFVLQCNTPNVSGITSVLSSSTAGESNSITNPGNPFYVLPVPCLIPFNPQNSPVFPWSATLDKHPETSGVHHCDTSYPNMENNPAATAQECETDAPDSVQATQNRQPGTSRQSDTRHGQHNTPDINATVSFTAGQVGDTSEKTTCQESITCSSDKSADAVAAAAEARRRRKELLHLKGHHSDTPHH
ncbi:putative basic-leucine zipper transcription factor F [Capsicum galapagoense]